MSQSIQRMSAHITHGPILYPTCLPVNLSGVAGSSDELHGELRRLEYAWRDVASAESLLDLLKAQSHIDGYQWGPVAEGLWTGVSVSYMRPFTKGLRVDPIWEQFEDPAFQTMHDGLRVLRDKLFAHTDAQSGREILLLPLGEEGLKQGRGFATESRATFSFAAIEEYRRLFNYQRERMRARASELALELSSRGEWKMGSQEWW